MDKERQFWSEIYVDGEQLCIMRDIYERIPPECYECGFRRVCEEPRSEEALSKVFDRVERLMHRAEFFEQMEEFGYYD